MRKVMKASAWIAAALVAAFLTACGGGGSEGSSSSGSTPIKTAEGVYSGTVNASGTSGVFSALVLEDDSIWAIYGQPSTGGGTTVYGFVTGSGTSNGTSYTAAVKDYVYTGTVANGAFSATYVPGVSISGSTGTGGTFNGTTAAVTGYNYNTPALLSTLTGTWTGSTFNGAATTVTFDGNGTYSGSSAGCAISGTLIPRPSGKNVFNATYNNATAGCAIPNASAQGIGVVSSLTNGKQQLLITLVLPDKSAGTVAFLTK